MGDDLDDQFLQPDGFVPLPLTDGPNQRDEELRATGGKAGHAAVPAGVECLMQQTIVADEKRPGVPSRRLRQRRQVVGTAAAVLDADDRRLVVEERERRVDRERVRKVRKVVEQARRGEPSGELRAVCRQVFLLVVEEHRHRQQ